MKKPIITRAQAAEHFSLNVPQYPQPVQDLLNKVWAPGLPKDTKKKGQKP